MTNEEYKELIMQLLENVEDNLLFESLFYLIQKIVGRGF